MTDRRVRVSAELYRRALADAIDWTESLMDARSESENPNDVAAQEADARWLARYKQAYAALVGPQPKPDAKVVPVAELLASGDAEIITDDDPGTAATAAGEE